MTAVFSPLPLGEVAVAAAAGWIEALKKNIETPPSRCPPQRFIQYLMLFATLNVTPGFGDLAQEHLCVARCESLVWV